MAPREVKEIVRNNTVVDRITKECVLSFSFLEFYIHVYTYLCDNEKIINIINHDIKIQI